jgi:RNA polymerase sigma-70 factor, ECF subfamily
VTGVAEEESALIERSRGGDLHAFGLLVGAYQDRIYHLVYRITGHHADAQDAAQDAFVKAYTALPTFRMEAAFSTWLHRIAVNAALTILRRRQQPHASAVEVAAPDVDPLGDGAERVEIKERVHRAIAALPSEQRAVLILRDIQGCTYEEIAAIIRVPLGTVRSRLSRAREALRTALADLSPAAVRAGGSEP